MATRSVEFRPHFGAFVLESLTLGMYGESHNALREYIQNGFDSLRTAVRDRLIRSDEARIEVTLAADRESLVVRDNGGGLHSENAVDVLASIGASNKDFRTSAGFRGIGRLAGVVFCDTLVFAAKAAGQSVRTVVTFDAKGLRERLAPHGRYARDAASTLADCVEAIVEDVGDADDHYFEVRLEAFHNPPVECRNFESLTSFLSQVSPLPFGPDFPQAARIREHALAQGMAIETVRVLARDGEGAFLELHKPYGADFGVKRERVALSDVDFLVSPNRTWWGWVGRKRRSGAISEPDARGIRVRVRNIQIDDTRVMRDIFAVSRIGGKPRPSYSRFAEWYVGEVHVEPGAAIPNARRDGFEEDAAWQAIRDELDLAIAGPYGRAAYKTSTSDQLSVQTLTRRMADFRRSAASLVSGGADWDKVSLAVTEANELQRRFNRAIKAADEDEVDVVRGMAGEVSALKGDLDALVADVPARGGVEDVERALSDLTQRIYRALRQRLPPAEWHRVREVIRDVSGEEPG